MTQTAAKYRSRTFSSNLTVLLLGENNIVTRGQSADGMTQSLRAMFGTRGVRWISEKHLTCSDLFRERVFFRYLLFVVDVWLVITAKLLRDVMFRRQEILKTLR